jgi:hypothetical protein
VADEHLKPTIPDRRQLSVAVNLFLKQILPRLDVESCARAILLTLENYFPERSVFGYLWHPVHEANECVFLQGADGRIIRKPQSFPDAQAIRIENSIKDSDDLILVAHRSLRSLRTEPDARSILERAGYRAAFESHFRYFGKPYFWVFMGVSNPRLVQDSAFEEFLLLFNRCCLVSLHAAYVVEAEGKNHSHESGEANLSLTLQWFHSILRHLNLGLLAVQTGETVEAENALKQANTVASLCLAQILWLTRGTPDSASPAQVLDRASAQAGR